MLAATVTLEFEQNNYTVPEAIGSTMVCVIVTDGFGSIGQRSLEFSLDTSQGEAKGM